MPPLGQFGRRAQGLGGCGLQARGPGQFGRRAQGLGGCGLQVRDPRGTTFMAKT